MDQRGGSTSRCLPVISCDEIPFEIIRAPTLYLEERSKISNTLMWLAGHSGVFRVARYFTERARLRPKRDKTEGFYE